MAATNKCLSGSNKSHTRGEATKKRRSFPVSKRDISAPAVRRTKRYGMSPPGRDHSGLMFAARITLAHFSASSTINFPNAADVIDIGSTPKPASRALIL